MRHYHRSACLAAGLAWTAMTATTGGTHAAPPRPRAAACAPPTATSTTSSALVAQAHRAGRLTRCAADVVDNVLVYDAARLRDDGRGRRATSGGRRAGARADRRARRGGDPRRLPRHRGRRPGDRGVRRDDRRRAAPPAGRPATTSPSAGANDRVWNALEKLAVRDPETFVDYYANDVIALVSRGLARARLPGHLAGQRRTPRRPGAGPAPRLPPRLPGERRRSSSYPTHVHLLSPVLTLQGAVAHSDMPVESGPTMYLPLLPPVRPRLPRLAAARSSASTSREHYVQLPLRQGRRRVLQPRPVPRRRHQRLGRHPARRQPAPGLVGVRPRDGDRRPRPRDPRRLPGAAATAQAAGAPDAGAAQRGRGRRRGLPVPDQPRPRPAGRRAHPAVAGRDRPRGARPRARPPTSSASRSTPTPADATTRPPLMTPAGRQGRPGQRRHPGRRRGDRPGRRRRPVPTVVVTGRRADVGAGVAAELEERGGREALFVAADVADVAQAQAVVARGRRAVRPGRLPGQRRRPDQPRHAARHHARAVRPARRGQPARRRSS